MGVWDTTDEHGRIHPSAHECSARRANGRRLNADIAGSGNITHSGGAKVTSHVSGSGDINAR
ncbi:hypothetical protein [Pengzhenrongella sp.]|uniref:hypothetical protein n=1 Tax=Pengzhenrongella sp. TaxID=2888820 RepID=UPI002F9345EE